jgi:hypothetical protein
MHYYPGDVCSLANVWYICLKNHTNHTPPNSTYWLLWFSFPLDPTFTQVTVNGVSDFIRTGYIAAYLKTLVTSTSSVVPVARIRAVTSSDMINNFGPSLEASIQDSAGVENTIGYITFERENADNSGFFAIALSSVGAPIRKFFIAPNGSVGVTTYPAISDGAGIDLNGKILRIRTDKTPASSSAPGYNGEICWDANYLYICTATDTWKRIALSSW